MNSLVVFNLFRNIPFSKIDWKFFLHGWNIFWSHYRLTNAAASTAKSPPQKWNSFHFRLDFFFFYVADHEHNLFTSSEMSLYCTPRAQNPAAHPQPAMFHFPRKGTNTHGASCFISIIFQHTIRTFDPLMRIASSRRAIKTQSDPTVD